MSAGKRWLIRRLRHEDLPLFRPLRLQALRDHPEAFGSSVEEEQDSDLAHMISTPPNATLGGFVNGALVATAAIIVPPKVKQRHKGHVVGVYVAPSWRGTGLARALMDQMIIIAREHNLVVLTIAVSVGNEAARRLYLNAGFVPYGTEPSSLKIGANLIDEEMMALQLVQAPPHIV